MGVEKPTTFINLCVKTKGGQRYIIEIQPWNHEGFDKGILYYLGKDYTEQIDDSLREGRSKKKGINWDVRPKVHVITITNFHRSDSEKNGILNGGSPIETYGLTPRHSPLNDHMFPDWQTTVIDVTKFEDKPLAQIETDRERWLFLLKNAPNIKEDEVEELKKIPFLKRH